MLPETVERERKVVARVGIEVLQGRGLFQGLDAGVELLTLGQYLQPTLEHLPVTRYLPPEEFDEIGERARQLGFSMVASGPFVRSSYHAGEMADEHALTFELT